MRERKLRIAGDDGDSNPLKKCWEGRLKKSVAGKKNRYGEERLTATMQNIVKCISTQRVVREDNEWHFKTTH